MKLDDFDNLPDELPEWMTSNARHKTRYFVKIAPSRVDPMYRNLRVKYIGAQRAIADVWDWDQENHEFTYTREISVGTAALHKKYKQLTDPADIKRQFTDSYKESLKRNKKLG